MINFIQVGKIIYLFLFRWHIGSVARIADDTAFLNSGYKRDYQKYEFWFQNKRKVSRLFSESEFNFRRWKCGGYAQRTIELLKYLAAIQRRIPVIP